MGRERASASERASAFAWNIPAHFNFATDVVDRWADNGDPEALIWTNARNDCRTFRYSDIARLSRNLGAALRDSGIRQGDRVLVVLPRVPEWQIAMVALLRIGAVPVPSIEMLTAQEIRYRAEHCGAKGIICRTDHAGRIAEGLSGLSVRFALGTPLAGWADLAGAITTDAPCPAAPIAAEDPAIIYYTSGSSGYPKGVVHAARGIHAWRGSADFWLDLSPADRIWCTADTGWSKAGTSILFGPWSMGACAFLYDGPFDPAERLRLIAAQGITVYCAPATELARLVRLDIGSHDLRHLRRTVSAGEAVNPAIATAWEAATGLKVCEAFGQTETLMTALTLPDIEVRTGSMGIAAPGVRLAVVCDRGRILPPGTVGNIALATPCPQLMIGYWNDPAQTEAAFVTGPDGRWFLTGDFGYCDEDGYFWYDSRADDVINSSGYRIGPIEVESALLEHDAVLEAAVIGVPDPDRGQLVKAFIVLSGDCAGSDDLTKELQAHVKRTTAPYKYPREIEYRASLPKGPTGKILRRALRDEYGQRP